MWLESRALSSAGIRSAMATPAHRALDEIDLSFADFLQQRAEDFDAVRALGAARDLAGLAEREVGRGTSKRLNLETLAVLTKDLPGAAAVAELQSKEEEAALNDNAKRVARIDQIYRLNSTFEAFELDDLHGVLKERQAAWLENIASSNRNLEEVASKNLELRKVPKVLMAELGLEQSDEVWEKLRIERIKDRRQAPGKK